MLLSYSCLTYQGGLAARVDAVGFFDARHISASASNAEKPLYKWRQQKGSLEFQPDQKHRSRSDATVS